MHYLRWTAPALALILAMNAEAQGIRQQRVRFKPGSSSATMQDTLKGDQIIDYIFGGQAGQIMSVSLKTTNGGNYFNVLPPGSEAAIALGESTGNKWSGQLQIKGDYRIRVFLVRAAARRGEVAKFALTIGITGNLRSTDAKVPGTSYHATGIVLCSVGTDPKGSANCSFGVIRKGRDRADVYLADPGFDVKLHKDHLRLIRFAGNTVTSANPKERVNVTMQSDNWLVSVDDFHFYTIPDAVVNGG